MTVPGMRDDQGPLRVDVEAGSGYRVVSLEGEFDLRTVTAVRTAIDDVLIEGTAVVVVDLTEVVFMDSSGLGVLVRARKKARVLRTELALVCPDGIVHRMIEMTGLVHVFPIFATTDAAIAGARA